MFRVGRCAIVLAVTIAAVSAFAQGTGGLRIRVIDGEGQPVEGAEVVLRHDAGRLVPEQAITDQRGEIEFPVLAAEGTWTIGVIVDGEPRSRRTLRVVLGRVTPVVLEIPKDVEDVPQTAPGIDVGEIAAITRFPESFVRELPIRGRFYQRVLPIAPGVEDADGDGNPRVHGATSRDFRAVVNGVANVDPATQRFMSFVNSDSIDQIAVIASGLISATVRSYSTPDEAALRRAATV